jgi:hypothetical protein
MPEDMDLNEFHDFPNYTQNMNIDYLNAITNNSVNEVSESSNSRADSIFNELAGKLN